MKRHFPEVLGSTGQQPLWLLRGMSAEEVEGVRDAVTFESTPKIPAKHAMKYLKF